MNPKIFLLFVAVITLAGCGVDEDPPFAGPYTGSMNGDLFMAYEDENGVITETEFEGHFEYTDIVCNVAQTADDEITMVIRIKYHEVFYIDLLNQKLHFEHETQVKLIGDVNGSEFIFPTQEPLGGYVQVSGKGAFTAGQLTVDLTIMDEGFRYKAFSYYVINMDKI